MDPIVIIGSGLAGYSTAREFRKLDSETRLYVITRDSGYFYSKPMISNALGKGQAPLDLPNADATKMAEDLKAVIWTHRRVEAIDTRRHQIRMPGETLTYGKLVLALGADAIRLPLSGNAANAVMSVNDLDDYAQFRQAIEGKKRIVILGAGLIGCEFANDLAASGYAVHVVEPFRYPLGRLVPEEAGNALRWALEALGVQWHFDTTCHHLDRFDETYRLALADGTVVEADVVLSAVGLRPRTDLAKAGGLTINRGIVVNRHLQTAREGVYALGDCMEVQGLVLPFVMPIMHAARALAKTLAGKITELRYPAMPVVVKTPAHPVVVCPPAAGSAGEWQVATSADGVRAVFRNVEKQLLGFTLTGSHVTEKTALAKELPPVLA